MWTFEIKSVERRGIAAIPILRFPPGLWNPCLSLFYPWNCICTAAARFYGFLRVHTHKGRGFIAYCLYQGLVSVESAVLKCFLLISSSHTYFPRVICANAIYSLLPTSCKRHATVRGQGFAALCGRLPVLESGKTLRKTLHLHVWHVIRYKRPHPAARSSETADHMPAWSRRTVRSLQPTDGPETADICHWLVWVKV